MPTFFTHGIVGAGLTILAPVARRPRWLWAASAGLSMLPDLDVVGITAGVPWGTMCAHRGITHSLPFAVVAGALTAAATHRALGGRAGLLAAYFGSVTAVHGVLDAFTNGGSGVAFLAPFDDSRHFFPWRPIEVSPISPRRFFTDRGLRVVASEAVWIWLPLAVLVTAVLLARRLRAPAGAGGVEPAGGG